MWQNKADEMKLKHHTDQQSCKKVVIYFFSGTGNAANVARWFADFATTKNLQSEVIDISRTDRRSILPPDPEALVVFVSPVHGFNYPPVMLHFILHFPKGRNKMILMNTRAGMLIGNWITPGLSGITFYLAGILLILKGFALRGILPVDMPSNWVSLHPGLNSRTVKYLHSKNKDRVRVFAEKVLGGKRHFKAVLEIYDILLAPVALAYYCAGRFFLAKTFYASNACNNCGLCLKACPVKAIIRVNNHPFWTFNCESCMKCMSYCPQKAIETGHGYIFLFVYVFTSFVMVAFYNYFNTWFFPIENSLLQIITESVLSLAFFAVWYRIIHRLLQYPFFERLIVYTSLTTYSWWGPRYQALKENSQSKSF